MSFVENNAISALSLNFSKLLEAKRKYIDNQELLKFQDKILDVFASIFQGEYLENI